MRKIIAALAALPLALAFVNPAAATHVSTYGDAVGPHQWVPCADIGGGDITELQQGPDQPDEKDPAPLLPIGGEGQGEKRVVNGVLVDIWVNKGSCPNQDRLGSSSHAVTFDASLWRKDMNRQQGGPPSFELTSQAVDVRTVELVTDPDSPFMLHLELVFKFEDANNDGFPDDGYVDETDNDGEGTLSDFYYCVQAASFIHKHVADWAPNLSQGAFDTQNSICTDVDPGSRGMN